MSIKVKSHLQMVAVLTFLAAGCGAPADGDEQISAAGSELLVEPDGVWPQRAIKTCWRPSAAESSTAISPSLQDESTHPGRRAHVQSVIAAGWEWVSKAKFAWSGFCTPADEQNPYVWAISTRPGSGLSQIGYPGSPGLASWIGIDLSARDGVFLHEFGHALAFDHEQDRTDTPGWCNANPDTPPGSVPIGAWDGQSIMTTTYCNNVNTLSPTDILGVRKYYGIRGELTAIVRGSDNRYWERYYRNGWQPFSSIGTLTGLDEPAVTMTPENRKAVFVRGSNNAIWTNTYPYDTGSWLGWVSLGGVLTSAPAATYTSEGRLTVFARGTDNKIWHKWYDGGWSGWTKVGTSTRTFTSAPAATVTNSRRLTVFARGTDNAIWHTWYDKSLSSWVEWVSLGGSLSSAPTATVNQTGRLTVFAIASNGAMYQNFYNDATQAWSGWTSIGGSFVTTSRPGATVSPEGRLVVFGRSSGNALYQNFYDQSWSGWSSLGGVLTSGPGAMD